MASAHPLTKPLKVERETLVYAVHDIVQPFPYWFGPRCLIPKRPRYYILHNETKTFKKFEFNFKKYRYIFTRSDLCIFYFDQRFQIFVKSKKDEFNLKIALNPLLCFRH